MSLEMAKEFIEKVKSNGDLQDALKDFVIGLFDGKGDIFQEVTDFAKTKGFDFIKDELKQALGGTDLTALLGGGGLDKLLGEGGAAGLLDKLGGMFNSSN